MSLCEYSIPASIISTFETIRAHLYHTVPYELNGRELRIGTSGDFNFETESELRQTLTHRIDSAVTSVKLMKFKWNDVQTALERYYPITWRTRNPIISVLCPPEIANLFIVRQRTNQLLRSALQDKVARVIATPHKYRARADIYHDSKLFRSITMNAELLRWVSRRLCLMSSVDPSGEPEQNGVIPATLSGRSIDIQISFAHGEHGRTIRLERTNSFKNAG